MHSLTQLEREWRHYLVVTNHGVQQHAKDCMLLFWEAEHGRKAILAVAQRIGGLTERRNLDLHLRAARKRWQLLFRTEDGREFKAIVACLRGLLGLDQSLGKPREIDLEAGFPERGEGLSVEALEVVFRRLEIRVAERPT